MNKAEWQRSFIDTLYPAGGEIQGPPPIVVPRYNPLFPEPIPSPPDEDLGPGWRRSYEIEDGAELLFPWLRGR